LNWQNASLVIWGIGSLSFVAGSFLLIGYLTPVGAILAALISTGITLSWFPPPTIALWRSLLTTALEMAIAVALICLGPGAFSVDARLFGRREIIIPGSTLPRK
jgi:uncharacterized membrane protein YphA (DoxX/SURF4 family)